ncbi:MAG: DUF1328 domain-containing protein [Candidatus Udaeobacter sp.]
MPGTKFLGGLLIRGLIRKRKPRTVNGECDSLVKGGEKMLGWAVTFLIIALVAAVLGFGGIAAASAGIAKILFFIFLVMCVIFFIFGWRGRGIP